MTSRIIEGCALSATIGNRKYRVRVTAERPGREWEGWEEQVFYVDPGYENNQQDALKGQKLCIFYCFNER